MILEMIDINPIQRYNLRAIQQIIQLKEKECLAALELEKINFYYQDKLQKEVSIRQELKFKWEKDCQQINELEEEMRKTSKLVSELEQTNLNYQDKIQKDIDIKKALKEKIQEQEIDVQQLKKSLQMEGYQREEQEVQIHNLEEKIKQLNQDLSKNIQRGNASRFGGYK